MKTRSILLFLLLALTLCGCKTTKKVAEQQTVTAASASTSAQAIQEQATREGSATRLEEATQTVWSDSIVEKLHERIVTDSCGRVLLHEVARSQDRYRSTGQRQTQRTGSIQSTTCEERQAYETAQRDSTYAGGSLREVTVEGKRSRRWLWFTGLLCGLFMTGFIISRLKR